MVDPDFLKQAAQRLRRLAKGLENKGAVEAVEAVATDLEAEADKIERQQPSDPFRD